MNGVRATGSGAVRVLTVDDHGPFLEVAHEMIHGMPEFEAVGEVISGADAMVAADTVEPDLVLIDVHMPGMSGIEASRKLSASPPGDRRRPDLHRRPERVAGRGAHLWRGRGAEKAGSRTRDHSPHLGRARQTLGLLNLPVVRPWFGCHGGRDGRDRGGPGSSRP